MRKDCEDELIKQAKDKIQQIGGPFHQGMFLYDPQYLINKNKEKKSNSK